MTPVLGNITSIVLDSTDVIPRTCSRVDENELSVSFEADESLSTILDTIVQHLGPFSKSFINLCVTTQKDIELADIMSEYARSVILKLYHKVSCSKRLEPCPLLTDLSLQFTKVLFRPSWSNEITLFDNCS